MTVALPRLTPAEYLARERKSETKSEFIGGQVLAMAGASEQHNLITLNVGAELRAQLRRRPCRVYPSDMRVRIDELGTYTYPDVTVVCDEPRFEDDQRDTLLNPTAIVEVLSKSTERYDRGRKFQAYRTLASLTEYVLIAQDRVYVEHYVRQPEGFWLLSEATELSAEIQLPTLNCTLSLADVYDKVEIEPEADMPRNGQEQD